MAPCWLAPDVHFDPDAVDGDVVRRTLEGRQCDARLDRQARRIVGDVDAVGVVVEVPIPGPDGPIRRPDLAERRDGVQELTIDEQLFGIAASRMLGLTLAVARALLRLAGRVPKVSRLDPVRQLACPVQDRAGFTQVRVAVPRTDRLIAMDASFQTKRRAGGIAIDDGLNILSRYRSTCAKAWLGSNTAARRAPTVRGVRNTWVTEPTIIVLS